MSTGWVLFRQWQSGGDRVEASARIRPPTGLSVYGYINLGSTRKVLDLLS
jgi:hypothetical protein